MNRKEEAESLTAELRGSDATSWRRLREFLIEKGIEPQRTVVADMFPEDVGRFGVLIAPDRRVFTFVLRAGERGDIRQQWEDVQVTEWWERRSAKEQFPYTDAIEAGLAVLEQEEGAGR